MIPSITRPTQATIHLEAIQGNLRLLKEHFHNDKQVFAVVKANAYGHGAVSVAKAIEGQVDGFCVSNIDEALELRRANITNTILVLGVIMPEQVQEAIANNLTITVSSLEWLDMVKRDRVSLAGLSCHIKVDSGMGRIGLSNAADINTLISELVALSVKVTGIFTHFATADELSQDYFNRQLTIFKTILGELDWVPDLVHASNSATSLWHTETIFNAVRLGIALYGLNPSGEVLELPLPLTPVLSLTSRLVQVKQLEQEQSIGYGATYQASKGEWIGTIPIGYADGWVRRLQGFSVLVDGRFCEIIGRVSMDQITVRLPKSYPIGTKVTLIGQDGEHKISATDLARHVESINYEVLCLLSDRIPRQYD